jgi:hypothetical protein
LLQQILCRPAAPGLLRLCLPAGSPLHSSVRARGLLQFAFQAFQVQSASAECVIKPWVWSAGERMEGRRGGRESWAWVVAPPGRGCLPRVPSPASPQPGHPRAAGSVSARSPTSQYAPSPSRRMRAAGCRPGRWSTDSDQCYAELMPLRCLGQRRLHCPSMEDFAMLVHKLTEPAKQGDAATVRGRAPLSRAPRALHLR